MKLVLGSEVGSNENSVVVADGMFQETAEVVDKRSVVRPVPTIGVDAIEDFAAAMECIDVSATVEPGWIEAGSGKKRLVGAEARPLALLFSPRSQPPRLFGEPY